MSLSGAGVGSLQIHRGRGRSGPLENLVMECYSGSDLRLFRFVVG